MRNLGIILVIVGVLLLILPLWFMRVVGVIGAICGLLAIIYPEKAAELITKFGSSKEKKEEE